MKNYQLKDGLKKEGFTLIELILVIFIIAVLSTLAINGYTQYRRSALLDFAADNFVAEFYALRDKTIHGNYGGEEESAKCYGLYFQHVDGIVEIKKIEIPYSGLKKPTEINEEGDFSWNFETCDKSTLVADLPNFESLGKDESVKFVEVYDDENGSVLSDFAILFVPPDGNIELDLFGQALSLQKVKVVIKYGESDENQFKRNVFIDLTSGKLSVTNVEDVEIL